MYELYLKTIDRLESKQLEDIFRVNKLRVKGFRINGPSNATKTKTMKRILTNVPEEKLITLLKKAAENYTQEKKRDYSWALITTINEKTVEKKIKDSSIGEVAFGLIYANKINLLEKFLDVGQEVKATVKEKETPKEKETNKDDELVKNLRKIITGFEGKIKKLEEKNKDLKDSSNELRKRNQQLQKDNKAIKKQLEDKVNKIQELEDFLKIVRGELIKTEKENQELKKLSILFFGNEYYKNYIDTQLIDFDFFLKYQYVSGSLDEIEDYSNYKKLVVLSFTLNKSDYLTVHRTKAYKYFCEVCNIIFIPSIEKLNEYIEKMRCYYE